MHGRWPGTNNVAVRFGIVVSLLFEGGATPENGRLRSLSCVIFVSASEPRSRITKSSMPRGSHAG